VNDEALDDALRAADVAVQPRPTPTVGEYFFDRLNGLTIQLGAAPSASDFLFYLLGGVLILAILVIAGMLVRASLRRRRPEPDLTGGVSAPSGAVFDLEALLQSDVRVAAHSLWLIIAERTAPGVWHPEQTTSQFLRAAARSRPDWAHHDDLRELARTLQSVAFGPHAPDPNTVRAAARRAGAWT